MLYNHSGVAVYMCVYGLTRKLKQGDDNAFLDDNNGAAWRKKYHIILYSHQLHSSYYTYIFIRIKMYDYIDM